MGRRSTTTDEQTRNAALETRLREAAGHSMPQAARVEQLIARMEREYGAGDEEASALMPGTPVRSGGAMRRVLRRVTVLSVAGKFALGVTVAAAATGGAVAVEKVTGPDPAPRVEDSRQVVVPAEREDVARDTEGDTTAVPATPEAGVQDDQACAKGVPESPRGDQPATATAAPVCDAGAVPATDDAPPADEGPVVEPADPGTPPTGEVAEPSAGSDPASTDQEQSTTEGVAP